MCGFHESDRFQGSVKPIIDRVHVSIFVGFRDQSNILFVGYSFLYISWISQKRIFLSGTIKIVSSLQGDSIILFYYPSASKILPDIFTFDTELKWKLIVLLIIRRVCDHHYTYFNLVYIEVVQLNEFLLKFVRVTF